MAKIRDAQPKNASGGYDRVFNNRELGSLMTRVQATVIRNGVELEKILVARMDDNGCSIENLDTFMNGIIENDSSKDSYICSKRVVCKSKFKQSNQPDFLIFNKEHGRIKCWVIELKDGDTFDTKKALGEKKHLVDFTEKFSRQLEDIPNCDVNYAVCCFNQENKENIKIGFKGVFDDSHIFTGRGLCEMLNLDYDDIVISREEDASDNLDYFIDQLLGIDIVRSIIEEK